MRAAFALPLFLAACIGGLPLAPEAPAYPLGFDAGGIDVIGSGQRIDFGRAQPGVIATMSRLLGGPPEILSCNEAGRTGAAWPGGPFLVFRNGSFTGHRSTQGGAGEQCTPAENG